MVQTSRARTRVVMARERLHELDLAMATGLEGIALQVLLKVEPPDAAPFGEGLVEGGATISYVDGKRVGGDADKKPKALLVRGRGVTVGVGYGFPARFQELGTVNQPARPFFTPVVIDVVGDESIVKGALQEAFASFLGKKARKLERQHNLAPRTLTG